VGYTLSAGKLDALTAAGNTNPLFLIEVSSILGAVLGYLMGQLSGMLKSSMVKERLTSLRGYSAWRRNRQMGR
jgi:hypothetical protein